MNAKVEVVEIASWSGEIPDWVLGAALTCVILAIVGLLWLFNRPRH
jgi:hypothetical protein